MEEIDFLGLRQLKYSRNGDILEVKLLDNNYNPYFKKKVNISNKKELQKLMEELKQKGVNFPVDFL